MVHHFLPFPEISQCFYFCWLFATRPNKKGGSCIDLIMTDCIYILEYSILNDFVSDHYTLRKKKKREKCDVGRRTIRDYSAFDKNVIDNFLMSQDWERFDNSMDPDIQWEIILANILAVNIKMCKASLDVIPSKL